MVSRIQLAPMGIGGGVGAIEPDGLVMPTTRYSMLATFRSQVEGILEEGGEFEAVERERADGG